MRAWPSASENSVLSGLCAGALMSVDVHAASDSAKRIPDGPRRIPEIENVWTPVGDEARIAARTWLTEDANHRPVRAVIEYIPFRKRRTGEQSVNSDQ